MNRLLLPLLVLLTALAAPAHAKLDFSAFPGTYKGAFQISAGASVGIGTLEARVMTNKSGKKLTIEIFGALAPPTAPANFISSFSLLQLRTNRTVTTNSVMLGYFELVPGASTFAGKKKTFTFTITGTTPFMATTTFVLRFSRKKMLITGTGNVGSTPVNLNFLGKKK